MNGSADEGGAADRGGHGEAGAVARRAGGVDVEVGRFLLERLHLLVVQFVDIAGEAMQVAIADVHGWW